MDVDGHMSTHNNADMIFVLQEFDNRLVIHTKTVLDKVKLKAGSEGCIAVVI